jgi:hypothetical protein
MSIGELWDLHLEISELLTRRLIAELSAVEQRLRKLRTRAGANGPKKQRSPRHGETVVQRL